MSSYMSYEVSQSLVPKSEARLGFQKVLGVLFRTPHVSHVHPQCKRNVAVETLQGFLKHSDSFSSTNFRCTSFSIFNSMIKVRNEKKVHLKYLDMPLNKRIKRSECQVSFWHIPWHRHDSENSQRHTGDPVRRFWPEANRIRQLTVVANGNHPIQILHSVQYQNDR